MPYIKPEDRELYSPYNDIGQTPAVPGTPGELNYQITCCVRRYIQFHGLSYTRINDVLGALEGAKHEFYRRVAAPYEDTKIEANGDVYP